jgi:DNA-binding transcriptional LysR family regulator
MRTEQLEFFIEVVEQKSFSRAARKLYVSQPTITQQVAALERELGFRLLDRTSRGVTLTPAGSFFYQAADQELENLNSLIFKAKRISEDFAQSLTIGYMDLIAEPLLLPIIQRFSAANPEAVLHLAQATPFELVKDLRNRSLNLALLARRDLPADNGFSFVPLASAQASVVVSTKNPLSSRQTLSRADLCSQKIILPEFNKYSLTYNTLYSLATEACSASAILPQNNLRAAFVSASLDLGVTILPDSGQFQSEHTAVIPFVPSFEFEFGFALPSADRTALEEDFLTEATR